MTERTKGQIARQAQSELEFTAETIQMMRSEVYTGLESVGITPDEAYAFSADLRALAGIERRLLGLVQNHENEKLIEQGQS